MKKANTFLGGLFIGIIAFIFSEIGLHAVLFCYSSFANTNACKELGSFFGGVILGLMGIFAVACRPLSAIACVIFNVSPVLCIPPHSKTVELSSMGINLFFWISVSLLFLYIMSRKKIEIENRKRNKWLIIVVIFWLVGFFGITKVAYYVTTSISEQKLSKMDIPKLILGSWDDGSDDETLRVRKYVETHYPDNTFKIEIVRAEEGKITTITHEGTYTIEGTIIKYDIKKTSCPWPGWKFKRRIIDLTDDKFLYIGDLGGLVEAGRIK